MKENFVKFKFNNFNFYAQTIFLIFWGNFFCLTICQFASQSHRCVNKKVIFHKNNKKIYAFKIFICAPAVGKWEKILLHFG